MPYTCTAHHLRPQRRDAHLQVLVSMMRKRAGIQASMSTFQAWGLWVTSSRGGLSTSWFRKAARRTARERTRTRTVCKTCPIASRPVQPPATEPRNRQCMPCALVLYGSWQTRQRQSGVGHVRRTWARILFRSFFLAAVSSVSMLTSRSSGISLSARSDSSQAQSHRQVS